MKIIIIIIAALIVVKIILWLFKKYGRDAGINPPLDNTKDDDSWFWFFLITVVLYAFLK